MFHLPDIPQKNSVCIIQFIPNPHFLKKQLLRTPKTPVQWAKFLVSLPAQSQPGTQPFSSHIKPRTQSAPNPPHQHSTMNTQEVILRGNSIFKLETHNVPAEIIDQAMPEVLAPWTIPTWKLSAGGRLADLVETMQGKLVKRIGELVETFYKKSLVYNNEAIRQFCCDIDPETWVGGPESIPTVLCLRRAAYQNLIDLCQIFYDCRKRDNKSPRYPTRTRSVRLAVAARAGDEDEVIRLLNSHYDPSACHNMAFVEAIRSANPVIVAAFLAQPGFDPGFNNSEALIYAAAQKSREVFEMILRHRKVDVDLAGATAAACAIAEQNSGYVELLIHHPKWPEDQTNAVIRVVQRLGMEQVDSVPLAQMLTAYANERASHYGEEMERYKQASRIVLEQTERIRKEGAKAVQQEVLEKYDIRVNDKSCRSCEGEGRPSLRPNSPV